jgi:hypothetical protein
VPEVCLEGRLHRPDPPPSPHLAACLCRKALPTIPPASACGGSARLLSP